MRSEASHSSLFSRLGRWISDRPRRVLAVMAALLAAAGLYGASAASHLPAAGFEVPGSESDRAVKEAEHRFGTGAADVLVLYRDPTSDVRNIQFATRILDLLEPVLEDEGVVRAVSYFDTAQETLVSRDGHETLVIVSLAGSNAEKLRTLLRIDPLLREIEPPAQVAIGGHVAASAVAQEIARQDVNSAEMIALPIAAVLTLIFFRSLVAALIPIAIGGFALASCAAIMRLGSSFTEIAIFALNVAAFLGLGLSIDYSLLLVQRFRQELGRGLSVKDAVAGVDGYRRARRLGVGARRDREPRGAGPLPGRGPAQRRDRRRARHPDRAGRRAAAASRRARLARPEDQPRRARPIARGDRTEPLLAPRRRALDAPPGLDRAGLRRRPDRGREPGAAHAQRAARHAHLSPTSEVRLVDEALGDASRFDPGGASAMQVVVKTHGSPLEPANLRRVRAYAARIAAVDGVRGVTSAFDELDPDALTPAELAHKSAFDPVATQLVHMVHEDVSLLIATGEHPWRSARAAEVLEAVRDIPKQGLDVMIGGPTAQMVDLKLELREYGRVAALVVIGWNFLMLLVAFRSVAVPIKAVLMNVLSLGASYGLLVWIFQDGNLSGLLGFEPLEGIDPTIPLVMFAVVFGLSMDYEVFLLSRIREEWLRSGDNQQSVISGLAHTGRIITSAALILLVVIGAFAAGELVYVQQIGVGLGAAIALDVTLVRALLVPATMQLLGAWNWWLPRWLRLPGSRTVAHRAEAP